MVTKPQPSQHFQSFIKIDIIAIVNNWYSGFFEYCCQNERKIPRFYGFVVQFDNIRPPQLYRIHLFICFMLPTNKYLILNLRLDTMKQFCYIFQYIPSLV